MIARSAWGTALLLAFLAWTPAAWAQGSPPGEESTAAQFFRAGLAAYDRHEYRAAAVAFEEAYDHAPRGGAIYNAGRGWESAGEPARAADAFDLALARGDLDEHDASYAREHLASLESSLGLVDVEGPTTATVSLDGTNRGPLPRKLHAASGAHDVLVTRRDGSRVDKTVAVVVGSSITVHVEDLPVAPEPSVVPPPTRRLPPPRTTRADTWIALGLSSALAVAGTVTYVLFDNERARFETTGETDGSEHSTAEAYRNATYVLWGAAVVGAIVTTVLFETTPSSSSNTGLQLGPGVVSGTF